MDIPGRKILNMFNPKLRDTPRDMRTCNRHTDNIHMRNINMHTPRMLCFALLLGATALSPVQSARADHLLPTHTLQCSANFPCPEAIQPRVHFWIEVFRSWNQETAILHDPERPARVYAVFNSGKGCNRAARSIIKRKRSAVEKSLRAIATKIAAGKPITNSNERHLAALFPAKNPQEIRSAAKRIRCQSGVRDSFIAGLKRYQYYSGMIDRVLLENGLPEEIRYLPFVESSYNPAAYSKAGAAGMWQIMPKTARVLGLELNATLDERLDPEAATRAAALYLRRADQTLSEVARETNPNITRPQINPFIITSYNYGVSGMKRAMRQVSPDFMAVLERYKSPRFQIAVKNFYASFLAARHVAINADEYFDLPLANEYSEYQTIVLEHPTSIARIATVFQMDEDELRPLNRALTRFVWRGWRLIPPGYRLRLPPDANKWAAERAQLAALRREKVLTSGDRYTVRRGDTACGIARALKVNCRALIDVNRLGKTALIIAGQKLVIPGKRTVVSSGSTSGKGDAKSSPALAATYRVRSGDSACGIAEKFAVGCRILIGHNRLGRRAIIYPGQTLSIPREALGGFAANDLNENNQYRVRSGDSACRVARKFAVSCAALRELNQLSGAAIIYPGQKLKIPGLVVPETSKTAQRLARLDEIKVPAAEQSGGQSTKQSRPLRNAAALIIDAPDMDANVDMDSAAETEINTDGITDADTVTDSETTTNTSTDTANEHTTAADTLRNLLDTLPDLGISVSGAAESPAYTVRVEADETLGHFADWLGIGGSASLRTINNLRYGRPIAIGQRLRLPVKDARMVERFEQRRTDYHQVLSESLKEHYDLVGIENHIVRRGDSPWSLSAQLGFPIWLLYRLNPTLRDARLLPGQILLLPKLRAKAG